MKIEALRPQIAPKDVSFSHVQKDGCFPEGAYLTTNKIEFFAYDGEWVLPARPRMDGIVREENNGLVVVESNKLARGKCGVW